MNDDIKLVEQYLKGIRVPEASPPQSRQRILAQVAAGTHKRWKTVAAMAALICLAATAGALIMAQHQTAGQDHVATSQYAREDPGQAIAPDTNAVAGAAPDVPHVQLTSTVLQPAKDDAEPAQVIESEVNGRLAGRILIPKRALTGSQMKSLGEGDLNVTVQNVLVTLPAAARTEMGQLRQAGKGENLGVQERQMKGRAFLFKRERYTLHDGTTVTLSVGEPKDAKQSLSPTPAGDQP